MNIAIDGVDIELDESIIDLSNVVDTDEKYVIAVDYKIDVLITSVYDTAEFFSENGIKTYLEI